MAQPHAWQIVRIAGNGDCGMPIARGAAIPYLSPPMPSPADIDTRQAKTQRHQASGPVAQR